MRNKGLAEYVILVVFILAMGYALVAALTYMPEGEGLPYLRYGLWLIMAVFAVLAMAAFPLSGKRRTFRGGIVFAAEVAALVLIVGAGAALRLVTIRTMPPSDPDGLDQIALYLAQNQMMSPAADGLRQYAARYPHTLGYPVLVLMPVHAVFGEGVRISLYANLACDMGSVLLIYYMGRRFIGRLAGVAGAAILSFWPAHILSAAIVTPDPAYVFCLLLTVTLLAPTLVRNELGSSGHFAGGLPALLFAGIVIGVAAIFRPEAAMLPIAYLLAQWIAGGTPGESLLSHGWIRAGVILVVCLIVNTAGLGTITEQVLQQKVSGMDTAGFGLMTGVNVPSGGAYNEEDASYFDGEYNKTHSIVSAQRASMQKALEKMERAPLGVRDLMLDKYRALWQRDDFTLTLEAVTPEAAENAKLSGVLLPLDRMKTVSRMVSLFALLFALVSAINAFRTRRSIAPIQVLFMLFILSAPLIRMLMETEARYPDGLVLFLMLLAVSGIKSVIDTPYQTTDITKQKNDDMQ